MKTEQRAIPFRVGGPIQDPADFIGREDMLRWLSDAMLKPQNVSVHGERRTGKTSLLRYLAHPASSVAAALPDNHIPVYFDFQRFTSADADTVWQALVEAIAEQLQQRHPNRQAEAEQFIAEFLTCSLGSNIGFERALDYLGACGFKIHLLFDEFDQTMHNPALGDPFYDALRGLYPSAENFSYVIATRTGLSALQPVYDQASSPFFNIFTTLILDLFQEKEVYQLIFDYFGRAGLDPALAEKLCDESSFLSEVTGYHPFFLQTLCYHLCDRLDAPDWPLGRAREEALKAFKRDSEPHFEYYWDLSSREEQALMKAMASGQPVDWNGQENLALAESLQERCLVVGPGETEHGWRLFSSVFTDWINRGGTLYDVMISYSYRDNRAVKALVNRLREDGYRVWLDEDEIGGGDSLVEVLAKGIEQSSHVMVCLSPDYLTSKWGIFEAVVAQTTGIDAQERKLIPIKVGECEIPEEYKWLYCPDLTHPEKWEREYKKATKNLRPGRPRTVIPSEPTFQVRFVDREQELNLIEQQLVDPGVKPYMYICAGAQMGKTFLLQELRRRYDGQKIEWPSKETDDSPPQEWRCAYVDLADMGDCKEDRLIAAILAALGDEPGATVRDLAESLQEHRAAKHKVLILLDSADRLSEGTAGFLPRLLRDLERDHLRQPAYFPGFVAASRRSFQAWEQSYDPILRQVELTPFTKTVVESLLKKAVRARNQTYEPQWYRDRAAEIAQCSVGHPGCIAALVRYFYTEYFVTRDLNADEVFSQCVAPVIENDILTEYNLMGGRDKIELDLARLARVLLELSTYRLITRPHVEAAAQSLGLALSSEDVDILEGEIRACLLVEQNREYGWSYVPYSLRCLLARWLELQQRNAAARHREAAAHYDAWLGYAEQSVARAPLTGDYQAAYICEALFHHTLGHSGGGPALLDHLVARLKAYAADLRPGYTGQRMADTLRSRMYRDKELRETVESRAGEGAYSKLLAALAS